MSLFSLSNLSQPFSTLPGTWATFRDLLSRKSGRSPTAKRRMRFRDRRTGAQRWVDVSERTGPLHSIHGKRALLVVDLENWRASARNLGCDLDYAGLLRLLALEARSIEAHAVFSAMPGDQYWQKLLMRSGYVCHSNPIETVSTSRGSVTHSNSDNWIAGVTMHLRARSNADAVIVGTGDGRLGIDIARMLKQFHRNTKLIATMSLAGSTSRLLQVGGDHFISSNFEIGKDFLRESRAVLRS